MKKFVSWLYTPYFFNPSTKFKLKVSLLFGLFVFGFLFLFKPFTLSTFVGFLLEYTAIIGVFTFFGSFFMLYIPPLIFKNYFKEDNWNIGRNIFFIFISILLVGTLLWYFAGGYKETKGVKNITLPAYLFYSVLVGTIPTFFSIYVNEKVTRVKREKRAQEISSYKKNKLLVAKKKKLKQTIKIYSENKKEHLLLNINELVYITSQGNYASFFLKSQSNHLKEEILRATLTKIDLQLEKYPNVIRCHKSYIVNSNYVDDVIGNARGYLLNSSLIPFKIPVSRGFSKKSLKSLLE